MAATRGALVLAVVLPLTGCFATKQDVQELRTEMQALRASQQETLREIRRQNEVALDSLSAQNLRMRGDIANRLLQMERQLVQIQELTGQGQQQVAELRRQIGRREAELRTGDGGGETAVSPDEADELFDLSLAALQRGSLATARDGFREFLRVAPQSPRASDAWFHLADALVQSGEPEEALQALDRIAELYPTSPRAPAALLRAGLVRVGLGERARARADFERVVEEHAGTPEATRARDELRRLDG